MKPHATKLDSEPGQDCFSPRAGCLPGPRGTISALPAAAAALWALLITHGLSPLPAAPPATLSLPPRRRGAFRQGFPPPSCPVPVIGITGYLRLLPIIPATAAVAAMLRSTHTRIGLEREHNNSKLTITVN